MDIGLLLLRLTVGLTLAAHGGQKLFGWFFVDLLCSQVPEVVPSLNRALAENELEAAYQLMPAVDLSRQILAPQPHRLLAVRDRTSGWADLGSPTRVMDILARNNVRPSWLGDGHARQDLAAAALTSSKDFQT